MKIDKQKLIDLLVEKTNMGRDEIKAQLDQLIERILDAAKRGKALEIKEFGVFYFDEEGELSFDAAEELSTEISFKYAGMKPVELKPERDTSFSEPEEEVYEEEPADEDFSFDDFSDEPKETEETKKETDVSDEPEPEDEEGDDSLYDPFSPEAMEPLEEPTAEEPEKSRMEDIKPVSRQPVRKRKDNTGIFILIGIIVIAAIIGGYFYYIGVQTETFDELGEPTAQTDPSLQPDENGMPDQTNGATTDTEQNQEMTGDNQMAAEQENSNQVLEEEIVSNTGVSASQTNQPLYGLTGTVIEQANSGYSIVLHSFNGEQNAMQAANRLRADGYRVIVTSRTVYGNMVWRVSVGQFETLGDAQQATTRLPEPYNTQNFIHRIRTN